MLDATSLGEKRPIMHFAKQAYCACRIRSMPTSKYASICSLDANYSFLFVSRLFFTQKYLSLNPLLEHYLPLIGEQWVKLEPLIPPPESFAPLPLCSLPPIT